MLYLGEQHITSGLSAATALTLPTSGNPNFAKVMVETQAVRFRSDGTDPTNSTGTRGLVAATNLDVICLEDKELNTTKFIEETTSAKIHVRYYRRGE